MKTFDYVRPATIAEAVAAAAEPGAVYLAAGTNLLDLMKGGVSPSETVWSTSRVCPGSIASNACPMAASASARWCAMPISRTMPISRSPIPPSPRRCCPAHRRSCAMPRPSAAICCSGRDAAISTTPPAPATSASPAPAATPAAARTGCMPCSAGARPASPPIRRISACRWSPSTPSWRSRAELAGARSRSMTLHRLPGDTPERDSVLEPGDLIVAVRLPAEARALRRACALSQGSRAHLLCLRRRVGRGCACGSRTAAIREARLALGGVAAKPWRARAAEQHARGLPRPMPAPFSARPRRALADAKPSGDNALQDRTGAPHHRARADAAAAGTPERMPALPGLSLLIRSRSTAMPETQPHPAIPPISGTARTSASR